MLRVVTPLPPDEDTAVTVSDAARMLGCDDTTVRALVDAGHLAAFRVGKCQGKTKRPRGIRISVAAIRRYKKRNAVVHGAEPETPADRPTYREARARLKEMGVL